MKQDDKQEKETGCQEDLAASFFAKNRRVSSFFFSAGFMSALRIETRSSVSESEKRMWFLAASA